MEKKYLTAPLNELLRDDLCKWARVLRKLLHSLLRSESEWAWFLQHRPEKNGLVIMTGNHEKNRGLFKGVHFAFDSQEDFALEVFLSDPAQQRYGRNFFYFEGNAPSKRMKAIKDELKKIYEKKAKEKGYAF